MPDHRQEDASSRLRSRLTLQERTNIIDFEKRDRSLRLAVGMENLLSMTPFRPVGAAATVLLPLALGSATAGGWA